MGRVVAWAWKLEVAMGLAGLTNLSISGEAYIMIAPDSRPPNASPIVLRKPNFFVPPSAGVSPIAQILHDRTRSGPRRPENTKWRRLASRDVSGGEKLGAAGRLDLSILGKRKSKVQNSPIRFVPLGARVNPLHSLTHLHIRS